MRALFDFISYLRAFLLLAVLTSVPLPLQAQQAALSGTVTDPQGAVVPGATVTLTNLATRSERVTLSDDRGRFSFPQLSPSTYEIRAEMPGFKTVLQTDLQVPVDTSVTINLRFAELGEISEVIIVTGETFVNTIDATLGNPFNALQIAQLPLESRNLFELLSLQAGVTQAGYVTGARSDQSNLTLDGIDVNEQQTGQAFESVLRVTTASVQEFRVTTTTPTAEQGRSSAGQVSLVTRSGTNEFHGSLFHSHRNTVTTANNFFNNRVQPEPIERPALLRNVFGGSIGGPIARHRAFFFFNYEGRTDRRQASVVREVPLPHLGQGQVRYINNEGEMVTLNRQQLETLFPDVGLNDTALQALAGAASRYPTNDDTVGDSINSGGFRFNVPVNVDHNTYIARLDFNLSDSHQLFIRGNYQWDNEVTCTSTTCQQFPDTPPINFWSHPVGLAAAHTWVPASNFVNTFRYGLTRQAFSRQGDSAENFIEFRFIFTPRDFTRTLSRVTPTHNIRNDASWIRGNHEFQVGTNLRVIRNQRQSFATSFDSAVVNPFMYELSGHVLSNPIADVLAPESVVPFQAGAAAVIGRYAQYSGNFVFGPDGSLLSQGIPSDRRFATEEYEFYGQDRWKLHPAFTLTYGLHWSYNAPVYETEGFQVVPTPALGDVFDRRVAGSAQGQPFNEAVTFNLGGPVHNGPGFYEKDLRNFSPRVAAAWSPPYRDGFLGALFGGPGSSSLRGGFAMLYDRVGSALAVSYDLNNTLGFTSSFDISANTFNVSDRPAPLFTGFDQDIRSLPLMNVPEALQFPLQHPSDNQRRIESSLDATLKTPVNYNWSFSWSREFGHGVYIEGSYIGRMARDLLARRDVMQISNLTDPASGMDWYTAGGQLAQMSIQGVDISEVPQIAYFENLFPTIDPFGNIFFDPEAEYSTTQHVYALIPVAVGRDWTWFQHILNNRGVTPGLFYHPQYGALSTWSSVANSDYHAFTLTARQRLADTLSYDLNYTFSKSLDNASGLQTATAYASSAFLINSLRPDAMKSFSDFDIRHMVNANWLLNMPFGRGRPYMNALPGGLDALLGGWNLNGILRWNSGLPVGRTIDVTGWATNWQVRSMAVRNRSVASSPTKSGSAPNLFIDPVHAYQSFRSPLPGEIGDRNVFRGQPYVVLDLGIGKEFHMPYAEGHSLQFRAEVFNVSNTQRLGDDIENLSFGADPFRGQPQPAFGRITNIQGQPRVMQFMLVYLF